MWQRDEKSTGRSRQSKNITEKESLRWINHYQKAFDIQAQASNSTIASIADREGDIHEWIQYAESTPEHSRTAYIIRVKANLRFCSMMRKYRYGITWNPAKASGIIALTCLSTIESLAAMRKLMFVPAKSPWLVKERKPLSLYVVYVKEKGVEWLLLTDLPVSDYIEARMIIK